MAAMAQLLQGLSDGEEVRHVPVYAVLADDDDDDDDDDAEAGVVDGDVDDHDR